MPFLNVAFIFCELTHGSIYDKSVINILNIF